MQEKQDNGFVEECHPTKQNGSEKIQPTEGEAKEVEPRRRNSDSKLDTSATSPNAMVENQGETAPSSSRRPSQQKGSRTDLHLVADGYGALPIGLKTITVHARGEGNRMSSLEMRRLPVDPLLRPAVHDTTSMISDEGHGDSASKDVVGARKGILALLCLRPGYSLRTQLMLSFGTISIITILAVVIICIAVAEIVGDNVKDITQEAFQSLKMETQGLNAQYLAESLTEKLFLVETIRLLREATLDRFAGYPSVSESGVPFVDIRTGQARYPIDFPPPPLEWQFDGNVDSKSFEEDYQGREYYRNIAASTATASFVFKGICDPSETDPNGDTYWPNCTNANNNITVGGVVAPTNTTELIYSKSKDLIPLLKALFESSQVINDIGVFFSNSGAGATLTFPHHTISSHSTYTSTGCEWMSSPNFYDQSRPIGTPEMIARCSPANEVVSSRVYNPLERTWCKAQALQPYRLHFEAGPDAWDNDSWLLHMGQAAYDRVTNEFIGCTYIGASLGAVDKELAHAKVVEGEIVSLIDLQSDGKIVSTSSENITKSLQIYDVDLGLTKQDYDELIGFLDSESVWDPAEVRQKYASFVVKHDKYFVTTHPVPPVPDEYDRTYEPLFIVVVSTPIESMYGIVNEANQMVDDRVKEINTFCIAAGAVGLVFALVIICMVAEMITRPLRKMNKVATDIVKNFGDPTKENAISNSEADGSKEARCTPRTELSDVVKEFDKLVGSFSGSSMVKTERHKHHEVPNIFTLHKEFLSLYESRGEKFPYAIEPCSPPQLGASKKNDSMAYIHVGTNLIDEQETFTTNPTMSYKTIERKTLSSPLFLWIVALMVTPQLFVNVVITAVALHSVSTEFEESVQHAEDYFLEIEKAKLSVQTRLRAEYVADTTTKFANEIHVLTRYVSWLLFGGVTPSDSLTGLITGMEECKSYSDALLCPFVEEKKVCDCAWDDKYAMTTCNNYPHGSRNYQRSYWLCQSDDADENGDRLESSYPKNSYSPASTSWWTDQSFVPGWNESDISDTGDSNLFLRIKSVSAIPVFEALYNYPEVKDSNSRYYVAFEADGLFAGYEGCDSSRHVNLLEFQSTVENGAAQLRPELCPLGKFGYDPRCRGWYDTGRNLALSNGTYLYVTAPYEFPSGWTYAQSITASIMDPVDNSHVGQVLLDYLPTKMFNVLRNSTPLSDGGFPVLVAIEGPSDGDTVIGPGYELSDPPASIASKVLEYDVDCDTETCRDNAEIFNTVVSNMKSGKTGTTTFYRTNEAGDNETVLMAFAPVVLRSFLPVDSADFSRGLKSSKYVIYSLALAETKAGLMESFNPIEEETQHQITVAIAILSTLLVVATILVIYVSLQVTKSIAEPMVYLLDIIRSIRKAGSQEAPDLRTVKASQEIIKFSDSIEMLSTVVRSANTAFYAGEFEIAYSVLVDALRLFRRLDNKKAVGIACNNLGNIMMGMYHEMTKESIQKMAGLTKRQLVAKGIAYFHEAIESGEKAYDEFHDLHGWTPICLDFMQHLSNRYFNRGLFLLSVKDCLDKPHEIEELGRRDLQISCDMDAEVIAYGEDIGWDTKDRIEKIYEIKIVRAGGFNLLLEMGYDNEWDIKDLLDEAFGIIVAEKKRSSSTLFNRLTSPGRMQEIEVEIMKYYQAIHDVETAAKVAIRPLFEDEKIFVDTMSRATAILLQYLDTRTDFHDSVVSQIRRKLRDYVGSLEVAVDRQHQTSINEIDSDVLIKSTASVGSRRRSSTTNWSLHQSSGRFVTMEDF